MIRERGSFDPGHTPPENSCVRHCVLYVEGQLKMGYYIIGTSSVTVPKPSIHQRKVLLCSWWDRKGPVYYEWLKQEKYINADLYCNQLDKLNAAIEENGQH
ncbi:mariner Mos1 transposase [Trichonephila clavipes]|nr:mariner Mos1 transposase [Trichonephila clavipes]